jgi:outer membrane protein OmpA-like peptidoglycan-associated protein/tetratricopeptide (TPR) repeat protein
MILYKTRFLFFLSFLILLLCSFNPAKRYIQKAEHSVERGNLKDAKRYYLKALEKDSMNPRANSGLGLMLSELLDNYSEALPYLERAYNGPVQDSAYDLIYALGKCYQHNGEYEKAITFYNRLEGVKDLEEERDLEKEIKKRKDDCAFAINHRNDPPNRGLYIVNAGSIINTEYPEYVPVLTPRNQIIFTSKRKDTKREKLNWIDAKYFESMYIADITSHGFTNPRRFTLPDKFMKSKFLKLHESVISLSQDGKKLFTFRDGDIYEADISELEIQKPRKLLTAFSEEYYQNHAFLTRDGKTLYFTSDAEGGLGGLDIYKCVKNDNGEWSKPKNLGENINSAFDDDAPFISHDGNTLYFSSEGRPGYGNYDIYKSVLVNGEWSMAENVGRPLNSPGHDIFLVEDSTKTNSYFSSGRNGGFGDMDIYRVLLLDKINTECQTAASSIVSLNIYDGDSTDSKNSVFVTIPKAYQILSSDWQLNGERTEGKQDTLVFDYSKPGIYNISNKMMLYCDTCFTPVIACNKISVELKEKIRPDTTLPIAGNNNTVTGAPDKTVTPDGSLLNSITGQLSDEQLTAIGFSIKPVLFGFDKASLDYNALKLLKNNLEVLKKYPELKVHIIGYTDSRGPDSYNKILSVRRAKAVQRYLTRRGILPSQVVLVEGKGATEFINNCGKGRKCPESSHRLNRRVIFIVSKPTTN